jgi:hypothetical protein
MDADYRQPIDETEDEYDLTVAEEAYQEYVDSGYKSRPISELWKETDMG